MNCQQLAAALNGQGAKAVEIFRGVWGKRSFALLGEQTKSCQVLARALYVEIKNIEGWVFPARREKDHDTFLAAIGDKTNPRENESAGEAQSKEVEVVGDSPGGDDGSEGGPTMIAVLQRIVEGQDQLERRMTLVETKASKSTGSSSKKKKEESLGAFLEAVSGGKIRSRKKGMKVLPEDSEEESEDGEESSEDEEEEEEEVVLVKKSGNERFSANFKKVPFPVQTLRYEKREGKRCCDELLRITPR